MHQVAALISLFTLPLVVTIGFENTSYTVREGDSNVTKCIVLSSGSLERSVTVTVTIVMSGEAQSEPPYLPQSLFTHCLI